MKFYTRGDERFSTPGRIFQCDPCTAYLLNGALVKDGMVAPASGGASAETRGDALRKAVAEMTDRRAFAVGGAHSIDMVPTWDIVANRISELPFEVTTYKAENPHYVDTTGKAAHTASRFAIDNAICELLEKNSLFLLWYGHEGSKVNSEVYKGNYYANLFWESNMRLDVFVVDRFAPVLTAVVIAVAPDGLVLMGTGAGLHLTSAINHAFAESYALGWSELVSGGRLDSYNPSREGGCLEYIESFRSLPKAKAIEESPESESVLSVVRDGLPEWVHSLHIWYLPQEVTQALRCVGAFSYELYAHRMDPACIDIDAEINKATLRLSKQQLQSIPKCPLS